jgi:hypothetical protein
MAKFFKNRDFRSGYYRDQTFMMAIGQLTVQQFLPDCMGIQLNKNLCLRVDKWGHFATTV